MTDRYNTPLSQPPDVSVGPFDQLRKLSVEQPVVGIYNRAMGLPAFDENSISNAEFAKFLQSQPANMDFLQGQAPSANVDDRRNEGPGSGFIRDIANQVLAAHQKANRPYLGERSAMGDQLGTPQDIMLAYGNK